MNVLSESQRQDVRDLQDACRPFGAEIVIIGAMAYRLLIEDTDRHTLDIDLALALDVDDFLRLEETLIRRRWQQSPVQEQRWTTPRDNRFDLLPAGPTLRAAGRLVWPRSGFVMSLAGFDQVFSRSVVQDLGDLQVRIVPPAVLALLKIAAYMDNPVLRAKDLDDLQRLLRWYEHDSPRVFSDGVLSAALPDIEFASAFLLGTDLRSIALDADRRLVRAFLDRMNSSQSDPNDAASTGDDWIERQAVRLRHQLAAFAKAFLDPTA